jgi:two-component system, NtrC family, response regulator
MSTSSKPTRLLIVEDDIALQRQLKWALDDYEVDCAATRESALAALRRHEPAIVLQDLGLPPDPTGVEEGFATLKEIQRAAPTAKVIVVTGREGREHALRAISLGAHDYCEKPVDIRMLALLIERANRIRLLELENRRMSYGRTGVALDGLIASSEEMLKVCRTIRKVAPTDLTVLLLGESGTGKERLAQALHALSARAAKPMVAINCAAIPESLLESELFGFEQGAFTGAVKRRIGKIESASGGTLFLDEIGDMPLALQAKLLRFLQERVIERIGGRDLIAVDVRIVVATNRNLERAIESGTFRRDLHYRISEITVSIPPLRKRESDPVLIANHLLRKCCQRHGKPILGLSAEAVHAIETHSWPGNVRELENRINSAAIMAEGKLVTAADLSLPPLEGGLQEADSLNLREVRQRAERQALGRALAVSGGNLSKAALLLGITRPTLYDLLERTSTPHGL